MQLSLFKGVVLRSAALFNGVVLRSAALVNGVVLRSAALVYGVVLRSAALFLEFQQCLDLCIYAFAQLKHWSVV